MQHVKKMARHVVITKEALDRARRLALDTQLSIPEVIRCALRDWMPEGRPRRYGKKYKWSRRKQPNSPELTTLKPGSEGWHVEIGNRDPKLVYDRVRGRINAWRKDNDALAIFAMDRTTRNGRDCWRVTRTE